MLAVVKELYQYSNLSLQSFDFNAFNYIFKINFMEYNKCTHLTEAYQQASHK